MEANTKEHFHFILSSKHVKCKSNFIVTKKKMRQRMCEQLWKDQWMGTGYLEKDSSKILRLT